MNLLELKIHVNTAELVLMKWKFDDLTLLGSSQSSFALLPARRLPGLRYPANLPAEITSRGGVVIACGWSRRLASQVPLVASLIGTMHSIQ